MSCFNCPSHEFRYKETQTVGSGPCDILLVGDYPRDVDNISGYPFTGVEYRFVWELMSQLGVSYYVTYLMKCIPIDPVTRRYTRPSLDMYSTCYESRFVKEVEELKPTVVLFFGQNALEMYMKQICKLSNYRGKPTIGMIGNHKTMFMATYSPSYIANNKDNDMTTKQFYEDVVSACRYSKESENPVKTVTINVDQLEKIVDIWLGDPKIEYVSYDTETNGLDPLVKGAKITSFSLAIDEEIGYNIFLYHPELDISDETRERIRVAAKKILTEKKVVSHNAKHEHRYTKVLFKFTPNITEDSMFMSFILYLSDPTVSHGLKYLSGRFAGMPPWEEYISRYVDLFSTLKNHKTISDDKIQKWLVDYADIDLTKEDIERFYAILKDPNYYIRQAESEETDIFMWMVPARVMERYAGYDAVAPLKLMKIFKPTIDADEGLAKAYRMMVKGAETFANVELHGVRIQDIDMWTKIYAQRLDEGLEVIRSYPEVSQVEIEQKEEYNPNSTKQSSEVFYKKFKFPVLGTTGKGNPSLSETVLIDLIKHYQSKEDKESQRRTEFLLSFREYKKLGKIMSGYLIGLRRFIKINDAFDGHRCEYLPVKVPGEEYPCMHPGYLLHGTDTGRLSSSNPSMHTIPYHSDVKRMIVPVYHKHGGLFVMADQSQLEIRVLASIVEKYYGDPSLAQAYREGRDIHRFNAGRVFAKPEEDIVDAERRFAKTISFSILYGSSEKSVAEDTGRTPEEVHELFEQFFQSFPGVRAYIKASHEFATKYGMVRTPMGRLKHIPGYDNQDDKGAYNRAMRQAQNGIIQSTGSDMSLLSIIYMDGYFRKRQMESKVVAFVHDSIAVDAHPGEFIECYDLLLFSMKDLLEKMDWITAPLGIDVEISDNYGDSASVKKVIKYDDGSRTYTLEGYDYVIDNVVAELKFSYDIREDKLISEKEFIDESGPLIARKSINLSFDNRKFNEQVREVTISKK